MRHRGYRDARNVPGDRELVSILHVPRGLERFRVDVLQNPPNFGNDRGIPDSAEGLYVQYLHDEKVAGLRTPDRDRAGNRVDAAEVELLDVFYAIRVLQLIVVVPDALQTNFISGG